MKALLALTLMLSAFAANAKWEQSDHNNFNVNQQGVCGIKVTKQDADLTLSPNDNIDYAENSIMNNKTSSTRIDIQYNGLDGTGLTADDVYPVVVVDGSTTELNPGSRAYTMNMSKPQQSFDVGLVVKEGELVKAGNHTIKLTYVINCN